MRRAALIIAALGLAACLDTPTTDAGSGQPSDPATETFAANLHVNIPSMTKTAIGVYYQDLKAGTGTVLAGPQIVIFSYETFLKNGLLIDQQLSVQQDLSQVVRGLQDGMVGMQPGGERIIVVPSALAFGAFAKPPIPANSTLVFDVILNQVP